MSRACRSGVSLVCDAERSRVVSLVPLCVALLACLSACSGLFAPYNTASVSVHGDTLVVVKVHAPVDTVVKVRGREHIVRGDGDTHGDLELRFAAADFGAGAQELPLELHMRDGATVKHDLRFALSGSPKPAFARFEGCVEPDPNDDTAWAELSKPRKRLISVGLFRGCRVGLDGTLTLRVWAPEGATVRLAGAEQVVDASMVASFDVHVAALMGHVPLEHLWEEGRRFALKAPVHVVTRDGAEAREVFELDWSKGTRLMQTLLTSDAPFKGVERKGDARATYVLWTPGERFGALRVLGEPGTLAELDGVVARYRVNARPLGTCGPYRASESSPSQAYTHTATDLKVTLRDPFQGAKRAETVLEIAPKRRCPKSITRTGFAGIDLQGDVLYQAPADDAVLAWAKDASK